MISASLVPTEYPALYYPINQQGWSSIAQPSWMVALSCTICVWLHPHCSNTCYVLMQGHLDTYQSTTCLIWTSRYVSTGIHTSFVIICVKFDLEWLGTCWCSVGVGVQESRHAKCLPCSEQIWLAMRNPKSVVPGCCSGEFPLPDFISFLSRPCWGFTSQINPNNRRCLPKGWPWKSSNQDLFLVYHPYLT